MLAHTLCGNRESCADVCAIGQFASFMPISLVEFGAVEIGLFLNLSDIGVG